VIYAVLADEWARPATGTTSPAPTNLG
jgi:hypothetical protein